METQTIPKEQRTQVAFQTFRRRASFIPALAYFGGRTLRFKITQPSVSFLETVMHYSYSPDPLDHIMGRQCVGEYESPSAAREEAYAKEFPKSVALDTMAAYLILSLIHISEPTRPY